MLDTDEGVWLIDCGLACAAGGDPATFYGPLGRRARFERAEALPERLAESGVDLDSVAGVLLTHLHYDHAGALVDLPPGVPVWVHQNELDAARVARSRQGYHAATLDAPVAWRPFHAGQTPIDGVALIETPGHTRGHCSALVQLGAARYLVSGDAAPTIRNLEERIAPGLQVDAAAALASLDVIIAEWRAGAVVLPSHDPDFWRAEPVMRFSASS